MRQLVLAGVRFSFTRDGQVLYDRELTGDSSSADALTIPAWRDQDDRVRSAYDDARGAAADLTPGSYWWAAVALMGTCVDTDEWRGDPASGPRYQDCSQPTPAGAQLSTFTIAADPPPTSPPASPGESAPAEEPPASSPPPAVEPGPSAGPVAPTPAPPASPSESPAPPAVKEGAPASPPVLEARLPLTGGPAGSLVGFAAALIVVGAAAVAGSRRKAVR